MHVAVVLKHHAAGKIFVFLELFPAVFNFLPDSEVYIYLLNAWVWQKFVKVFPHEYKRVLGIPRIPAGVLAAQAGKSQAQGQVIRG